MYFEECLNEDKRPLHLECEWYQICQDGKYVTRRCPINSIGRQMFNPQTNNCTDNIKLEVDGKCHSYRECLVIDTISPFGKWKELKCGENRHFNKKQQNCVILSESTCGKF